MPPGTSVILFEPVRPAQKTMVFLILLETYLTVNDAVFDMDKTCPKDFSPYLVANLEGQSQEWGGQCVFFDTIAAR